MAAGAQHHSEAGWCRRPLFRLGMACGCLVATFASAFAHGPLITVPVVPAQEVPDVLRIPGDPGAAPAGMVDLKFRDIFKSPIGPRGLEATAAFRKLDGKRVRIIGYMVALIPPTADAFMFSPLPAAVAVHDEGLADDIPPSTIYVRLPRFSPAAGVSEPGIPQAAGLVQITGVLSTDSYTDPHSGRIFPGTLVLDPEPRRAVMAMARAVAGRTPATPGPAQPRVLAGAVAGE